MKKSFILFIGLSLFMQLDAQQSTTGKYRPEKVSDGISGKTTEDQIIISNVPSYLWRHGCGPTALGMIIGYYDGIGFSDLISGSPFIQNENVNNAIANDEHYTDYSVPLDYYPDLFQDKSVLGGAHTSDCIADFMQTSWSSEQNRYGWSWVNMIDNAFEDFIQMQNSSYYFTVSYNWFSGSSWSVYKDEIDKGRPVILVVDTDGDGETDHFVTGIAYDETDFLYGVYNTWNNDIHWYMWREMLSGNNWGIYGFNLLDISFSNTGYDILASVNPNNAGTVSGIGNYSSGETANMSVFEGIGFDFVNWTENGTQVSTELNYNFTVTGDRILVANFNESTSITEREKRTKFNIYPIPTEEIINIKICNSDNKTGKIDIHLYDCLGKEIMVQNDLRDKNTIRINISDESTGIYFLKISIDGKENLMRKIILIK